MIKELSDAKLFECFSWDLDKFVEVTNRNVPESMQLDPKQFKGHSLWETKRRRRNSLAAIMDMDTLSPQEIREQRSEDRQTRANIYGGSRVCEIVTQLELPHAPFMNDMLGKPVL